MWFLIKVTQGSRIPTRGAIFYKLVQLLAQVNDLALTSVIVVCLKETFLSLVQAADDICLKINEVKAKALGRVQSHLPQFLSGVITSKVSFVWGQW
jgi:hypothetical protein